MAQEAGCFHDRAAVRAALEAASGRVAQVPPRLKGAGSTRIGLNNSALTFTGSRHISI